MALSEQVVTGALDNIWRTVLVIKRRIRVPSTTDMVCTVLRRLASVGAIECREQPTSAPKYRRFVGGPVRTIEFYRRIQR
jgi:hypothetical protein